MMSLPSICTLLLAIQTLGMFIFKKSKWGRFILNICCPLGVLISIGSTFFIDIPLESMTLSQSLDYVSLPFVVILMITNLLFTLYNPQSRFTAVRELFFLNLVSFFIFWILTANNTALFLTAFEVLTLSIFFLLLCTQRKAVRLYNVWLYFIITHIAFFLILCAFSCYHTQVSDLSFSTFCTAIKGFDTLSQTLIFLFLFIGFAIKSGIFPFHVWIPGIFASVPTPLVGVLSASVLNLGIYGMLRFLEPFLFVANPSWGITLIAIAVISLCTGIFSLTVQQHFRRYTAFSIIVNHAIIIATIGFSIVLSYYNYTEIMIYALVGALFMTFMTSLSSPFQVLSTAYILRISGSLNINRCGAIILRSKATVLLWLLSTANITLMPFTMGFFALVLLLIPVIALFSSNTIPLPLLIIGVLCATALPLATAVHSMAYQKAFGIGLLGKQRGENAQAQLHFSAKFLLQIALFFLLSLTFIALPAMVHYLPKTLSEMLQLSAHSITLCCDKELWIPLLYIYGINIFFAIIIIVCFFAYNKLKQRQYQIHDIWNQGYSELTPKMYGSASSFTEQFNELLIPGVKPPQSPIPTEVEFPNRTHYRTKSDIAVHDLFITIIPYFIKRTILQLQFRNWAARWIQLFYILVFILIVIGIYCS